MHGTAEKVRAALIKLDELEAAIDEVPMPIGRYPDFASNIIKELRTALNRNLYRIESDLMPGVGFVPRDQDRAHQEKER